MSKTYKLKVSNETNAAMQAFCEVINSRRPADFPKWESEDFARFLVHRSLEIFQEDMTLIERYFLGLV